MSKALAQAYVRVVSNDGDTARIDEFVDKDIVDHSAPPGLPSGIEGQRLKIGAFRAAFPDLHIEYEFHVAEGDMVGGRFRLTGTHEGEFAGLAASGNRVSVTGHDFLRFADGRVTDHWLEMDMVALMQQLQAR